MHIGHAFCWAIGPAKPAFAAAGDSFIHYTALFRDGGGDGTLARGGHGALYIEREASEDFYVAPFLDTLEPARIRAPMISGNNGESIGNLGRGDLHDGDVHMVAMRISMNATGDGDPVQVLIDPDLVALAGDEPNWNLAPGMDRGHKDLNNTDYNIVAIRSFTSAGPISFDEIRIATTWAEAAPIPEPATISMVGLAGLLMFLYGRRRARN